MDRVVKAVFACAVISIVVAVPAIWAYWVQDGVAVCTATWSQSNSRMVTDAAGGAIVVWQDTRSGSGNDDIYAQRVNASGNVQWVTNGVALCAAAGYQDACTIVSDGAGGAVVTWRDNRSGNGDIYAQRVNASGEVQWAADGVALCDETSTQNVPISASDGAGGAIAVWDDYRNGNVDIYAQRMSSLGAPVWLTDGVSLCTAADYQFSSAIVSDGAGGAIAAWTDFRDGISYKLYAQRVDVFGTVRWTVDGVALCTAAGGQDEAQMVSDGAGGAIAVWVDYRNGNFDIYAQRVNASGVVQWGAGGVALCTVTGTQDYPAVAADGAGGAIVAWEDYRSGSSFDIYVQRVDASGAVQWTENGVALCTVTENQRDCAVASNGEGGAFVSWMDRRTGINDIYVQRVDASGAAQWTGDGLPLCTAVGNQSAPNVVTDGRGGAVIAWQDSRNGTSDVYMQYVDSYGRIGILAPEIFSVRDVPGDQGGKVFLSWYAARPDLFMTGDVTYYSIWRAIDPGLAMLSPDGGASVLQSLSELDPSAAGAVVRIEQAEGLTYFWELVETVDAAYMESYGIPVATLFDSTGVCAEYHYFQVAAHTADPMVFCKSAPDSGYSVDNIAPCAPLYLAGEQSYVPEGLALTWKPNGEPDLDLYRVYRDLTEDFEPAEDNLLGSPCDTLYFDGDWSWSDGFYYKVSAVDVHGNESAFALLSPEQITGGGTPPVPDAGFLSQNYPNPFNPMTRIDFGLAEPAHVSLRIYDAAGRLVRALVEGDRPAGRHSELWDGRDGSGREVASGVYFYRLDTGSSTRTRKMVLAR